MARLCAHRAPALQQLLPGTANIKTRSCSGFHFFVLDPLKKLSF